MRILLYVVLYGKNQHFPSSHPFRSPPTSFSPSSFPFPSPAALLPLPLHGWAKLASKSGLSESTSFLQLPMALLLANRPDLSASRLDSWESTAATRVSTGDSLESRSDSWASTAATRESTGDWWENIAGSSASTVVTWASTWANWANIWARWDYRSGWSGNTWESSESSSGSSENKTEMSVSTKVRWDCTLDCLESMMDSLVMVQGSLASKTDW
jgi:hypothetical protein